MFLVVGAGLSGAVIAERIANVLGDKAVVIDKRGHIGGNIYDYQDENGIFIHKYGPHAFHTDDSSVWSYLSSFTGWRPYFHRVEAFIDGQSVPVPFNFNSISSLFPRRYAEGVVKDLTDEFGFNKKVPILELLKHERFKSLAEYIYRKVFLGYTVKQWGKKPEELDISVSGRVPVYTGKDDRYFQDKYQGIPENGYTAMIANMLNSDKIEVRLNRRFCEENRDNYKKIIYTGMIDEYYDYRFGSLPYRSLNFEFKTLDMPYYQKTAQKNYPENFDFTRITEFKHFLSQNAPRTVIAYEYPTGYEKEKNEPYYPVPDGASGALYEKYRTLASSERDTVFIGRLAEYKYYNMDQIVSNALRVFERRFL